MMGWEGWSCICIYFCVYQECLWDGWRGKRGGGRDLGHVYIYIYLCVCQEYLWHGGKHVLALWGTAGTGLGLCVYIYLDGNSFDLDVAFRTDMGYVFFGDLGTLHSHISIDTDSPKLVVRNTSLLHQVYFCF